MKGILTFTLAFTLTLTLSALILVPNYASASPEAEPDEFNQQMKASFFNIFSTLFQKHMMEDGVAPMPMGNGATALGSGASFLSFPKLDMLEQKEQYVVSVEVPGIEKDDVVLEVFEDYLKVSHKSEKNTEEKGDNYIYSERRFGSFERVIKLPYDADTKRVSAKQENGILEITVAKEKGSNATSKKIDIK